MPRQARPQLLCLGTLFAVTRNLLGKQLGQFPDAGLKKKKNFLERERACCQNLASAV